MEWRGALGPLCKRLARLSGPAAHRPGAPTSTHLHRGDGIDWNEPAIARSLETLRSFQAEFNLLPAHAEGSSRAYHYENPYFSLVDAAVCHAFVRERQPSVVIEVGSGYSSRVIRQALDANGSGRLVSIDPEPRAELKGVAHEFRRQPVQEIPLAYFEALPADAILFIDSSHRAGAGSDVNFLFLEVLPSLPPGVLVHVHDIYLPEDYPASWNIDEAWGYTEQYLLHALLCHSPAFAITWPGRYCVREHSVELSALFATPALLGLHCSFWFQRTGPTLES